MNNKNSNRLTQFSHSSTVCVIKIIFIDSRIWETTEWLPDEHPIILLLSCLWRRGVTGAADPTSYCSEIAYSRRRARRLCRFVVGPLENSDHVLLTNRLLFARVVFPVFKRTRFRSNTLYTMWSFFQVTFKYFARMALYLNSVLRKPIWSTEYTNV